jgi:hypothetical protein
VLPDIPVDELARVGHATPLPLIPIEPVGTGLRPVDGSSVAPMPNPVGGTDVPAVMPGGEVVPIPGVVSTTCATAGGQPSSTDKIEDISAARILARMAISSLAKIVVLTLSLFGESSWSSGKPEDSHIWPVGRRSPWPPLSSFERPRGGPPGSLPDHIPARQAEFL